MVAMDGFDRSAGCALAFLLFFFFLDLYSLVLVYTVVIVAECDFPIYLPNSRANRTRQSMSKQTNLDKMKEVYSSYSCYLTSQLHKLQQNRE